MKKRFYIFMLAILILPAAALTAQENAFSFLSFNIGFGYELPVDGSTYSSVNSFGVDFRIAGPLIIGFERADGGVLLNFFKAKFDVMPEVRAVIGYGDNRALFGFEVIPFRREVSGLFTEFKLLADYFTGPNFAFDSGIFRLQLAVGIGF